MVSFGEHEARRAVLDELHVRPFLPFTVPHRLHHFAFVLDPVQGAAEPERLAALCTALGAPPPGPGARFHSVAHAGWTLRWELHAEFATYTWATAEDAEAPFGARSQKNPPAFDAFVPTGRLLVAVDLALVPGALDTGRLEQLFDRASLTVIEAAEGKARVASDFRANDGGTVRLLVEDFGLSPTRAGRLAQRLLELETYRCLALLGLPVARRADPELRRIEQALLGLSREMTGTHDPGVSRALLYQLTALSAELEAQIAETSYRFGATRAYSELVATRLDVIREREHSGYVSFSRFLRRRFSPAIATCNAIDGRQQALSVRLAHAVDLLRTRIQLELEEQNRALLMSMNRRSRLQLRLQQTVEGLSVAAISYYVVGLVGYMAKGLERASLLPKIASPELVVALSVPLVVLAIWGLLRRARAAWVDREATDEEAGANR